MNENRKIESNKQAGDTDVLRGDERTGSMRDEMVPKDGQPMQQRDSGGNRPDTAGKHGDMAPETAKMLGKNQEQRGGES